MPSHDLLKQLDRLDRSSSGFHDQVNNILYGEEYKQSVPNLRNNDLVWLVDYLDNVLDILDTTSAGFRKGLHELREICSDRMTLPTSYTLSPSLLNIGRYPAASGGSGDVYEGTLDGSKVCIKHVELYSKDGPENATKILYSNVIVWKRLKHQNIVGFLGITSNPLQLISERMPNGDLAGYIGRHPDTDRLGLVRDIVNGLYYLHSRNVVHGDLKGPNILVDAAGHSRIADFGLAMVTQNLDSLRRPSDQGYTTRWTAPEILNNQGTYSKEADVFSFAMVMIEVFTGAVPFGNNPSAATTLAIMGGERPQRPTHPTLTDELWTLVQYCWDQDPSFRPEVSEVLKVVRRSARKADGTLPTSPGEASRVTVDTPTMAPRKPSARGVPPETVVSGTTPHEVGPQSEPAPSPPSSSERLIGTGSNDSSANGSACQAVSERERLEKEEEAKELEEKKQGELEREKEERGARMRKEKLESEGRQKELEHEREERETGELKEKLEGEKSRKELEEEGTEEAAKKARETTGGVAPKPTKRATPVPPPAIHGGMQEEGGQNDPVFSPSPPALRQLHRLNRSSSRFQDQLSNVVYGEEYRQCVPNLQGDESVWLVDYLDKALDSLDPSSPAFRKCLRELRSVSSARGILPTSYTISSNLLNIAPEPFTSGGYGVVHEGTLDGSRVCIKRIPVYTLDGPQKAAKTFCQEAIMWKYLIHPNIVPLLGVTITPKFQLISGWMSGGDLPEHIKKSPDADRRKLLFDVAKGLCYLHSCNVIHGDLKGSNILMDNTGNARLADFGLATVTQNLDSVRSATCQRGFTPRWAAPEVLDEGRYSKEADVFSFAMVMIEVFTGAIPFSGSTNSMAILAITQGKHPPRPTHPTFTENLWTLMQRCWNHDPRSRPEVSEVLPVLLTPNLPAWKRLISHPLPTNERIFLITAIFLDQNQVETVRQLPRDDAQSFVDIVYEALDSLAPEIRRECLRVVPRICGRQALLPQSLVIPLCYNPMEDPLRSGGFAEIWKGRHQGREVAAKVLKIYKRNDPEQIKKRFCRQVTMWKILRHPNVLPLLGATMSENRFVMVSAWIERGTINEFVKAYPNADRLGPLRDATKGLIYMHDEGVVHGDPKGANLLVDDSGHACWTDFDLITIASERSTDASTGEAGGTLQWMSPERLDPEHFGLKKSQPTKESDCYALGMVIYEVLSGQTPFAPSKSLAVILKVLDGQRPERPQGEEGKLFTDAIWRVLQLCWKQKPKERTNAKTVLSCLEETPSSSRPSHSMDGIVETDTEEKSDAAAGDPGLTITRGGGVVLPIPSQGPPDTTTTPRKTITPHMATVPKIRPSPPAPPHNRPPGATRPTIPSDDSKPPTPPQKGSSKERWSDRFARKARRMFKATS